MSSLIDPDEISHETELVWLEDIDNLDYVRQSLHCHTSNTVDLRIDSMC